MASGDTEVVKVGYPDREDLRMEIALGATRLRLRPGEGEDWVSGSYRDTSGRLPLRVLQEGGLLRITQGRDITGLVGLLEGIPTLDLALGKGRAFSLKVESGASENRCDLGGVPLTRLAMRHGAGKHEVQFTAPNPETMTLFDIGAGAGIIAVKGLANAGVTEVRIEGGAGSFECEFSGTLKRDMHVRISSAMSSVRMRIPSGTPAMVASAALLGSVDVGDGFTKREGAFWTPAGLEQGEGPRISVDASAAMGSVRFELL
jgi:hypothetical protein